MGISKLYLEEKFVVMQKHLDVLGDSRSSQKRRYPKESESLIRVNVGL